MNEKSCMYEFLYMLLALNMSPTWRSARIFNVLESGEARNDEFEVRLFLRVRNATKRELV